MSEMKADDDRLGLLLGDGSGGYVEESELFSDPDLAGYADALVGYFLVESPSVELPSGLRGKVMAAVAATAASGGDSMAEGREGGGEKGGISGVVAQPVSAGGRRGWGVVVPWAMAAGFAVVAAVTAVRVSTLQEAVEEVRGELEERESEAGKLVATLLDEKLPGKAVVTVLDAQAEGRGGAVAVWDGELQEVVLHVSGLPPVDASVSDYQLWIVDPQYEVPVDGGIFQVSESGMARHRFHAPKRVDSVAAFAVTKEKAGGVEVSAGPHLLLGAVGK